ncbi:MAG TPA: PASTA domain-containing protein [Solirubrobacterales bacterium]
MALFLLTITVIVGAFAGTAAASPGALRILILESQCDAEVPAATLRAQILAHPGVSAVDFFDGSEAAPTAAQLLPYDVVLAMGDCTWLDAVATGNSLADYQDQGGVVVGATFDWEGTGAGYTLDGRWITAGYSPYEVGADSAFENVGLGAFDPTNPLLSGVSGLSAYYRNDVTLTPGATELAKWSDGTSAVATKGNALAINAYLGDDYFGPGFSPFEGDFGRLIVNAGNVLGRHMLTVSKAGSGTGTVSSAPAGIACGASCTAAFNNGSVVTLTALPLSGAKFSGWSGAGCTGTSTCVVPISAAQTVSASFDACVVPKLKKKKLKRVRTALQANNCKLGKVTPKAGKGGRVIKQRPAPGRVLPYGSAVNVKLKALAPKRPAHRKPQQ